PCRLRRAARWGLPRRRSLATEHFARLPAAWHDLHHIAVAGVGDFAGRPLAAGDEARGVNPLDVLLALGQAEAAAHELLRRGVEFPQLDCVAAAVGERDQADGLGWLQAVGALPDPVLALGLGERIE